MAKRKRVPNAAQALLQKLSLRIAKHVWELFINVDQLPESEAFKKLRQALERLAEARGEARGAAKVLLRYVARRGVDLTAAERDQIASCTDLLTLERWQDAVFAVDEPAAIRAALFGPMMATEDLYVKWEREQRGQGALEVVQHWLERRLGRSLTASERATLLDQLLRLGADRVGDRVLGLAPEQLAAWLAQTAPE